LPPPTPVSPPLASVPRRSHGLSRVTAALLLGLALVPPDNIMPLRQGAGDARLQLPPSGADDRNNPPPQPPPPPPPAPHPPAPPPPPAHRPPGGGAPHPPGVPPGAPPDAGARIASLLHSDADPVFRAAFADLTELHAIDKPAALAIAESVAAEYAAALAAVGPRAERSRALNRLAWMAKGGNTFAAERVAAFEKSYDEIKRSVATSAWWVRGQGARPGEAARWMENGELLAETGDRPAMLDLAFALGYGRTSRQDRAAAVETYLKVIARADGGDAASAGIRQAGVRGLS